MSHLVVDERQELDRPILIAAWSGWNDAGEAATGAIRFMLRRWRAKALAHIDPENFYDFTQARPKVRIENGERVLEWPENQFSPHKREGDARDLVLAADLFHYEMPDLCETWRGLLADLADSIHTDPMPSASAL